jgi:hypothetical protein
VEVGLIDINGSVLAGVIALDPQEKVFRIPLDTFTEADFLIIPRPFPEFLLYKVTTNSTPFDWSAIETLQMVVMPGKQEKVDVRMERVWIE